MTRHTLPIHAISSINRQRLDNGDLDSLVQSMRLHGLIQPVVINQDKRLIAGGRRLAAASVLGWTEIDVVFRETLSADELHILELEENIQRLDETWQEQALHTKTIHDLKVKLAALEGKNWTQSDTAALLGYSEKTKGHISISIFIAKKLLAELGPDKKPIEGARYWAEANLMSAVKLSLRDRFDEGQALLLDRAKENSATPIQIIEEKTLLAEFEQFESSPDLLAAERLRYESNPLNTIPFDDYWKERQASILQLRNTIYLSNQLYNCDSIEFMHANAGRFDHIITDIPYGIDMDHLNQQNPHGGMVDIDKVEELHDVEYNLDLIANFFPAAFAATKEKAFVITWADQMLWQYMYDHAVAAGFAVQRWPITWVKTSRCMNQCIAYNTTKNTEIAIICRKPGSIIAHNPDTSVIITSRQDDITDLVKHPFAKPRACWNFLAGIAALEGQTILEPFAGGGSGVLSMLDLRLNVIACELDKSHFAELMENVRGWYLKLNSELVFK